MKKITPFFKGMTQGHISQRFHSKHKALDIYPPNEVFFGYGHPLTAPEDCEVLGITNEQLDHSLKGLEYGYGVKLKGLETGHNYLYWHCLPVFPVWGGDKVKRGKIVAYMGNSGTVYQGGKYVPIENRDQLPLNPEDPEEEGLHAHVEMYDKKGKQIDPTPHINFLLQPDYTVIDQMKSTVVVLQKIVRYGL